MTESEFFSAFNRSTHDSQPNPNPGVTPASPEAYLLGYLGDVVLWILAWVFFKYILEIEDSRVYWYLNTIAAHTMVLINIPYYTSKLILDEKLT